MNVFALVLPLGLLATACSESHTVPVQHLDKPADPTFSMFVSNQSFDLDPVDIKIKLDDQLAVTGDFVVEGQHTWIKFDFALTPGNHTINVSTGDVADVALQMPFVMDDRKYAVVSFWFYEAGSPEPTPPHFSFQLLDEPPLFE
ncbi:MAG: hypothetical protein H0T42_04290 [Deltaproteobacteria bacterium]|nr:hypothetical protein [Deltaproteobacteria bacterium]